MEQSTPQTMPGQNVNFKYKTVICKHFTQHGQCQMGDRCHFAHGQAELRQLSDPLPESYHLYHAGKTYNQNKFHGGDPNASGGGLGSFP